MCYFHLVRKADDGIIKFFAGISQHKYDLQDAFRLYELPALIGKPVGVDEKEIKASVDHWLR